MSEQMVNIGYISQKLRTALVLTMVCFLAACVPSGEQDVNTELFKDKEDMKVRATELKPGMQQSSVFKTLGVPAEKFERMNTADMQMSIYGNSQVQGSPEQLEAFKQRMMVYEGYTLPYREIKSSSSLGFGKMKMEKTGYDLRLVLIFERGKLIKSTVEGTQEVKQNEDQYLWTTLISKGIGSAF